MEGQKCCVGEEGKSGVGRGVITWRSLGESGCLGRGRASWALVGSQSQRRELGLGVKRWGNVVSWG